MWTSRRVHREEPCRLRSNRTRSLVADGEPVGLLRQHNLRAERTQAAQLHAPGGDRSAFRNPAEVEVGPIEVGSETLCSMDGMAC
jgi:hypothetical protein